MSTKACNENVAKVTSSKNEGTCFVQPTFEPGELQFKNIYNTEKQQIFKFQDAVNAPPFYENDPNN